MLTDYHCLAKSPVNNWLNMKGRSTGVEYSSLYGSTVFLAF